MGNCGNLNPGVRRRLYPPTRVMSRRGSGGNALPPFALWYLQYFYNRMHLLLALHYYRHSFELYQKLIFHYFTLPRPASSLHAFVFTRPGFAAERSLTRVRFARNETQYDLVTPFLHRLTVQGYLAHKNLPPLLGPP